MAMIIVTPKAKVDLELIKEYISKNLDNPIAGQRIISSIIKRIRQLEDFPTMGARLSSVISMETNFRFLVCTNNYLIFYKVDEDYIKVFRILNGRTDYAKILFSNYYVEAGNDQISDDE